MAKMIIMRGLPASGKSTLAEELLKKYGNTVRINKDLLRTMLHFDKFTGRNEGRTWDAAMSLATCFLNGGVNVIIDDTNLNPNTVERWKNLALLTDSKLEYHHMDVSVEECVKRDEERKWGCVRYVGEHVIKKMALQYLDYLKGEKVVICDLDGTLADIQHRLHYAKGETKDWERFFGGIKDDIPRIEIVDELMKREELGHKIIFVSARPEKYREATEAWLADCFKGYRPHELLIMRDSHDKRPDTEVKSDIYDKYLSQLDIMTIYDDRPSVIRMWREKGLHVTDVGEGIEF